jgi:hypothetical protein
VDGTTSNYAYAYDSLGWLLTVTKNGTLVEKYVHGPLGRRIAKKVDDSQLRNTCGRV